MNEVLDLLAPSDGRSFLDLTVGAGGHAAALLEGLGEDGLVVGVDRDPEMLGIAAERLTDDRVELLQGNLGDLAALRDRLPRRSFHGILADLGVSSLHLDAPERGFGFRHDGPLDMRMDPGSSRSARELVNEGSVGELTRIIAEYGEERHAGRVARAIVEARQRQPLETTAQLAAVVRDVVGSRKTDRIDPATRTFQGIRIAVNDELGALDRFLRHFDPLLEPEGRLVILSYHSLEDRRVKEAFRERARRGDYEILTPRPLRPTDEERRRNPRSRSAKLRALEKKGR